MKCGHPHFGWRVTNKQSPALFLSLISILSYGSTKLELEIDCRKVNKLKLNLDKTEVLLVRKLTNQELDCQPAACLLKDQICSLGIQVAVVVPSVLWQLS